MGIDHGRICIKILRKSHINCCGHTRPCRRVQEVKQYTKCPSLSSRHKNVHCTCHVHHIVPLRECFYSNKLQTAHFTHYITQKREAARASQVIYLPLSALMRWKGEEISHDYHFCWDPFLNGDLHNCPGVGGDKVAYVALCCYYVWPWGEVLAHLIFAQGRLDRVICNFFKYVCCCASAATRLKRM